MLKEKYDIIIVGGQSNAEGSGIGPVENAYVPTSQILYLQAEKSVDVVESGLRIEYKDTPFVLETAEEPIVNGNTRGDFALSFATDYIARGLLATDRKIMIIKSAIGGTGFYRGHWGLQDKVYLKMLEMVDDFDLLIVPYESKNGMQDTKLALSKITKGMKVGLVIGPEGGFEQSEIDMLIERKAQIVSLGKRILRTETAAILSVGMLMLHAENFLSD